MKSQQLVHVLPWASGKTVKSPHLIRFDGRSLADIVG